MQRSFRYRLNPTHAQTSVLQSWLHLTRELYNAALTERRDAWQKQHLQITRYDQQAQLPAIRVSRPEFTTLPIVAMRGPLQRLDKAFNQFFRNSPGQPRAGFPRFKSAARWSSITFDDLNKVSPIAAGGKRIKVSLLGKVKLRLHRPVLGVPKTMAIKLDANGHWYVTLFCVGVPTDPLPRTGREGGIDLGLIAFAATSDGSFFNNPRPYKTVRIARERASRRVSRRKKGSKRRKAAVRSLAKLHDHVANIRRENHITVAKALVAQYDTIYVEALNIKGLARGRLAKSVNDAGWGNFLHWLRCKAESAGREVVEVNPAGTSQICSGCGCEVRKDLSVRVHDCPHCGLKLDRDVNAARNVLRLGQSLRRGARVVITTPMTRGRV